MLKSRDDYYHNALRSVCRSEPADDMEAVEYTGAPNPVLVQECTVSDCPRRAKKCDEGRENIWSFLKLTFAKDKLLGVGWIVLDSKDLRELASCLCQSQL